jgi:hypothetical protein
MKYIAAREVFGGYLYFQDNINDSPKWTTDKKEAMRFESKEDALDKSDRTKVYTGSIIPIKVEE